MSNWHAHFVNLKGLTWWCPIHHCQYNTCQFSACYSASTQHSKYLP